MSNPARRPHKRWKVSDLVKLGFVDAINEAAKRVAETGEDEWFGHFIPEPNLAAWSRLSAERVPPEVLQKCKADIAAHPDELTIRKNDKDRTLMFQLVNVTGTCPPDCTRAEPQ